MKNLAALFFFASCTFFMACGGNKPKPTGPNIITDIRKFYYPVDSITGDGVIYAYKSLNTQNPPYYWWLTVEQNDQGNPILHARRLNDRYQLEQSSDEEILPSGTLCKSYLFHYCDRPDGKCPPIEAKITDASVFPFTVSPDTSLVYRFTIDFQEPGKDKQTTLFTRDRYYRGVSDIEFEGKKIRCASFKTHNVRSFRRTDGGLWKSEYNGEEQYAEGIGLVRSRQVFSDSNIVEYALYRIYTPAELAAETGNGQ